jgi:hypothetical protein
MKLRLGHDNRVSALQQVEVCLLLGGSGSSTEGRPAALTRLKINNSTITHHKTIVSNAN